MCFRIFQSMEKCEYIDYLTIPTEYYVYLINNQGLR